MKKLLLLSLLAFTFSCSQDDDSDNIVKTEVEGAFQANINSDCDSDNDVETFCVPDEKYETLYNHFLHNRCEPITFEDMDGVEHTGIIHSLGSVCYTTN